mmetsp:Transcript_15642/g.23645  ORF Transcript_15642/g.23645 Transcript_15642/m.23645 type:complete len:82 (+) Transcript_15642:1238-1483(+)
MNSTQVPLGWILSTAGVIEGVNGDTWSLILKLLLHLSVIPSLYRLIVPEEKSILAEVYSRNTLRPRHNRFRNDNNREDEMT